MLCLRSPVSRDPSLGVSCADGAGHGLHHHLTQHQGRQSGATTQVRRQYSSEYKNCKQKQIKGYFTIFASATFDTINKINNQEMLMLQDEGGR